MTIGGGYIVLISRFSLFLHQLLAIEINKLTGTIVDLCIKIHNKVSPGCFERVYEEILYYELCKLGIEVRRQLLLPIKWEELKIEIGYKLADRKKLVVELRSIYPLPSIYFNQLRTQLSLMDLKHGMLINFKVELMKDRIHRVFNNFGQEEYITKG